MKKLVLMLLRCYKAFLSPYIGTISKCRFTPTCSHYTYQAVEKYGASKGCFMGLKRFLRCNPLFKGGFDPLP